MTETKKNKQQQIKSERTNLLLTECEKLKVAAKFTAYFIFLYLVWRKVIATVNLNNNFSIASENHKVGYVWMYNVLAFRWNSFLANHFVK